MYRADTKRTSLRPPCRTAQRAHSKYRPRSILPRPRHRSSTLIASWNSCIRPLFQCSKTVRKNGRDRPFRLDSPHRWLPCRNRETVLKTFRPAPASRTFPSRPRRWRIQDPLGNRPAGTPRFWSRSRSTMPCRTTAPPSFLLKYVSCLIPPAFSISFSVFKNKPSFRGAARPAKRNKSKG